MYLLDISIVSNYLDKRRNFPLLTNQILNRSPELIFISIITVEEIIQVSLATLQKLRQKSAGIYLHSRSKQFQHLPVQEPPHQILSVGR